MTRPTVVDIPRLQRALIRLLWDSVADQATCTCFPKDRCPQCEAMTALGLGRWRDYKSAQTRIAKLAGKVPRARVL